MNKMLVAMSARSASKKKKPQKNKPKWQVNLSILQIDLIMFQIIILIILQVDIKKVAYQQILFFLHDDDKKGQCRRDKLTC